MSKWPLVRGSGHSCNRPFLNVGLRVVLAFLILMLCVVIIIFFILINKFLYSLFVAGYSEDSDYTSDLNYPVGQHANSSASQFRNTAHQMSTPQRSLETSRENSYETDEPPGQPMPVQHGHHLAPGKIDGVSTIFKKKSR